MFIHPQFAARTVKSIMLIGTDVFFSFSALVSATKLPSPFRLFDLLANARPIDASTVPPE